MRIQHNISAINANRNLTGNNSALSKSLEKLSSGYAINRAGDNAAGLAISEKMRAQITCLNQAETNCNDGVSLIQTAEGALQEVHSMLNRMTELAEQSANGTYDTTTDRANLEAELKQLKEEVTRVASATNFNGTALLNGNLSKTLDATTLTDTNNIKIKIDNGSNLTSADKINLAIAADGKVTFDKTKISNGAVALEATDIKSIDEEGNPASGKGVYSFTINLNETKASAEEFKKFNGVKITVDTTFAKNTAAIDAADYNFSDNGGLKLQIGDTSDTYNQLTVEIHDMSSKGLGLDNVSVATQDAAASAIATIKTAINTVSSQRGTLGAMQNRLEHTINNLSTTNENITNAESRIRDTDMAKEMMTYTSKSILAQAAQSMLAQANQQPQQVLSLLQ